MYKFPVGIENYKEFIDKNYYYVDKTLLIKDIIDIGGKAVLFTRPRRFGKTLVLSMLQTFFENEIDVYGNKMDNYQYFENKNILSAGEAYTEMLGKYPVISLSLKSAKQPDFEMSYESIVDELVKEFERHRYVLTSDRLIESVKQRYMMIMERRAEKREYSKALEFLSACLKQYHNQKTIILIDEYDVPLENAYFNGFYEQMTGFVRSLFESALKTNNNLEFAIITGCMRISKESIFTGLNNFDVVSILNNEYAEYFGFTSDEVQELLNYYKAEHKTEEITKWYNGYLFGKTQVYNPWSIINYVKALQSDADAFPKPYWSNTSSNSIVRELVENADEQTRKDIEDLISGKTIEKPVHEEITYEDIYKTQDNLWNFLFFTGYLRVTKQNMDLDTIYMTLQLPNMEVRYIFRNTIQEWFNHKLEITDLSSLYEALQSGECDTIEKILSNQLLETISYYDYAENYYHGFLSGILKGASGFVILSNRESGNGRPDIIMKTLSVKGMAIIIEIKAVKEFKKMQDACEKALEQIEKLDYETQLHNEGYRKILKYGICFCGKECVVKRILQ